MYFVRSMAQTFLRVIVGVECPFNINRTRFCVQFHFISFLSIHRCFYFIYALLVGTFFIIKSYSFSIRLVDIIVFNPIFLKFSSIIYLVRILCFRCLFSYLRLVCTVFLQLDGKSKHDLQVMNVVWRQSMKLLVHFGTSQKQSIDFPSLSSVRFYFLTIIYHLL